MKANHAGQLNQRRIGARKRLQEQLESNTKQPKGSFMSLDLISLDDKDEKRIKKEISTLDNLIVSPEVARSTRSKKHRGAR